ncbi:hypothetical protein BX600DRAFT_432790 [Xylariales sp. PMI_506]|nr:hypothetical protein BX600DRAFT_432790 [Xylariales sp. PMI_506]
MSPNPLPLTLATLPYDRVQPLSTGEISIPGVSLNHIVLQHPRDIFDRMPISGSGGGRGAEAVPEFDASELSLSEYVCRHAAGHRDLVAIPVFPSRAFRHGYIAVNTRTVREPCDLAGKRVGVQLYTMTAAVWIRALLRGLGVDLSGVRWVQGSMESGEPHGKPSVLPPRVVRPGSASSSELDLVANDTGRSLSDLLAAGELDATIGADLPSCLRSGAAAAGAGGAPAPAPHVARLFPDYKTVERAYFAETRIFPIMHTVVLRRSLAEAHPWLPTSLYNALADAKEVARLRLRNTGALRYMLPWMTAEIDEIDDVFPDGDPFPDGIEPNRPTLQALVDALYDQGMIAAKPALEDLFAPIRGQNWKIGLGPTAETR